MHKLQFSIRTMMIVTAVIAVLCCIFFTLPIWVGGLFLLILVLLFMPAMLAALIYGSGSTRAFAVGASPPMCIVFLWFTFTALSGGLRFVRRFDYSEMRVLYALVILVVVVSGFVAQAVRWGCMPRKPSVSEGIDDGPGRR